MQLLILALNLIIWAVIFRYITVIFVIRKNQLSLSRIVSFDSITRALNVKGSAFQTESPLIVPFRQKYYGKYRESHIKGFWLMEAFKVSHIKRFNNFWSMTNVLVLHAQCVASGNPIPQVTWQVYDNIAVPDNSRYRTGDYVTREALLVSYVNISNITPEGNCIENDNTFIGRLANDVIRMCRWRTVYVHSR